MVPTPDIDLGLDWLVRLRWGVVAGQIATVAFGALALGSPAPVAAMALVAVTAASNAALRRIERPGVVHAAVVFDLAVFTALLGLTGGASNPFSVLYLLHVALAAVLLGPAWTGGVTVLAAVGFGLLFLVTDPHAMHRAGAGAMQAHLWGMWVAFAATGAGISWFVARLASALRRREAELVVLRRRAEAQERMVSLATLAAGAAHELGSPLAAIAIAAKEIELLAGDSPEVVGEARAQRAQVDRCRDILGRLTQRAGAAQGEMVEPVGIAVIVARIAATLPSRDRDRLRVAGAAELAILAPPHALGEAVGSLVHNALLAGPGEVVVSAEGQGAAVLLTVADQGAGMGREVLDRVGEPFFTTRPTGEGMGLGLFLARRFAESVGGGLSMESAPGSGTRATLRLPGTGAK